MTASNQPSGSDIGTLFALFCERIDIGGVGWRDTNAVTILNDGSGMVTTATDERIIVFNSIPDAISKLRVAIEAAAPKPAEVSEPDGYHYIQRGNPDTGEWESYRDEWNPKPKRYADSRLAHNYIKFKATVDPGISFRLADSNGLPLSIPLTVSSELEAGELGKLGALDMDAVYGEGK